MSARLRAYHEAIEREIANWPGAAAEFGGHGSRHPYVLISFGGQSRKSFYPASPSHSQGPLNKAEDVRRILRELGARRTEERGQAKGAGQKRHHRPRERRPATMFAPLTERVDKFYTRLAAIRESMRSNP